MMTNEWPQRDTMQTYYAGPYSHFSELQTWGGITQHWYNSNPVHTSSSMNLRHLSSPSIFKKPELHPLCKEHGSPWCFSLPTECFWSMLSNRTVEVLCHNMAATDTHSYLVLVIKLAQRKADFYLIVVSPPMSSQMWHKLPHENRAATVCQSPSAPASGGRGRPLELGMVSNYYLTITHQLFVDSLSLFRSFSVLSVLIIAPKLSSDFLPLHPFLIQILFTSCPSKKKKSTATKTSLPRNLCTEPGPNYSSTLTDQQANYSTQDTLTHVTMQTCTGQRMTVTPFYRLYED